MGSHCRVSYEGADGIHSVEVNADTLYEAVAMAEFKQERTVPNQPGAMTEFTVAVHRPPIEHSIRLGQVAKWAEHTTKDGPAGITKRERVRQLLGA